MARIRFDVPRHAEIAFKPAILQSSLKRRLVLAQSLPGDDYVNDVHADYEGGNTGETLQDASIRGSFARRIRYVWGMRGGEGTNEEHERVEGGDSGYTIEDA